MIDNITNLSENNISAIRKLTAPLEEKFGITYFARQSVSNEGYWEIIGNQPQWLAHSADCGFYDIDPSLLHPGLYKSGLVVNSSHSVPDFLKPMSIEAKKHGLDHALCILQKTKEGSDWYFFGGPTENYQLLSTYITQVNTLYRYINHFNQEAKRLINKNLDNRIDLNQLKTTSFTSEEYVLDLAPMLSLPEIMQEKFQIKLSKREAECLHYLIAGKTMKETSILLDLSPRTVEGYITRLKNKTGCTFKSELITLLQDIIAVPR